MMPTLSIIIPVFNEEHQVLNTIAHLQKQSNVQNHEIIVVDGGSTDKTVSLLQQYGINHVVCAEKSRAAQMNLGAKLATKPLLYFLHADSLVPSHFDKQIFNAYNTGATSGCFRLKFDHDHWFLKFNSWFTRFNVNAVRFGDQSLFVKKKVFDKCGGYNESLLMMEDQEIIHRLKKYGSFRIMDDVIITSSRKYLDNGIYRMQFIFFRLWLMYYLGYSQQAMLHFHRRKVRKHKL